VTQANVGASWKAGLHRTIGSICGAVAAAMHGRSVLCTTLGAFVAFGVGGLIWPVHARAGLRSKIANIREGAGAITAVALQGIGNEQQVRPLDRQLHDLRRGITQQMDEAKSELAFSLFNQGGCQAFVDLADQVRPRLTAMAEDGSLYVHAQLPPGLVPSLPALDEKTEQISYLWQQQPASRAIPCSTDRDEAIRDHDADLARLREQRSTAAFALDRMLPFWALVFNLREIAQDLKQLKSTLPQLAGAGFVAERIEKSRAGRVQFLFQPRRAVAITACPGFGAILIAAFAAVVSILHASQVEIFLPVRPLLLQRRGTVADFHPPCGLVFTEPGFLHVAEVFALGD
jgi:hypothetical protein